MRLFANPTQNKIHTRDLSATFSHELLPKFRNILKDTPSVKNIVYFEHQVNNFTNEIIVLDMLQITIGWSGQGN